MIFAAGNIAEAYHKFEEEHECNKYCRAFKLPTDYPDAVEETLDLNPNQALMIAPDVSLEEATIQRNLRSQAAARTGRSTGMPVSMAMSTMITQGGAGQSSQRMQSTGTGTGRRTRNTNQTTILNTARQVYKDGAK